MIGVDVQVSHPSQTRHLLPQCCRLHQQTYTLNPEFCKSKDEGYYGMMGEGLVYNLFVSQEVSVPRQYCDRRVQVLQKDAMQLTIADLRHAKAAAGAESEALKFNVVLSDMCHSTLGVVAADVARSLHLARCAAGVAIGHAAFEGMPGCHKRSHICSMAYFAHEDSAVPRSHTTQRSPLPCHDCLADVFA